MARMREALSNFSDPSQRIVIQNDQYRDFRTTLASTKTTNPYALPAQAADLLENMGILSNPFAAEAHTHAAAKAIENDLYYIASHQLPKEPVSFLFMKPAKLRFFRRGPQLGDRFINTVVEPKDVARYSEDTLVKAMPALDTRVAFMGDSLHFLPFSFLTTLFTQQPTLQTLVATMVLPMECKFQLASTYPSIYTLKYHAIGSQQPTHFSYAPGGHKGAEYIQPIRQLDWLSIGHLSNGQVTVTAQRLESKGANHLFIFQRGNLFTPPLRNFSSETIYTTLPKIFLPEKFNVRYPIRKTLVMQLFLYIKSVKQVTERDIWAKIRQLIKTEDLQNFTATELLHLTNYFLFLSQLDSKTCFEHVLSGSIFKKIFRPLKAWFETVRMKVFGEKEFVQLTRALEWVDISLEVEVQDVDTRFRSTSLPGVDEDQNPFLPLADEKGIFATINWIPEFFDFLSSRSTGPLTNQPNSPATIGVSQTEPRNSTMTDQQTLRFLENTRLAEQAPEPFIGVELSSERGKMTETPEEPNSSIREIPIPPMESASTSSQAHQEEETQEPELPWKLWLPVLQAAGFEGTARIPDSNNDLIHPVTQIQSVPHFEGPLPEPELVQRLKQIHRNPAPYKICWKRARAFASDVKNNRTGSLTRAQPEAWKEAFTSICESTTQRTIGLSVLHGAGGSGKSFVLQKWLTENPDAPVKIVVPTNELRLDWLGKLPQIDLTRIQTFEKALISPAAPVVIFDDYTKLPNGYIDAFLSIQQTVALGLLTGDSRQSDFHETNEEALINGLNASATHFAQFSRYYLNATHRNKQDLARFLGVYSERTGITTVTMSARPLKDTHLLVPSMLQKKTYTELGYKTSTYAGCQGITAPYVQVLLNSDTCLCSEKVLYTALSRAVHSIHFINTSANSSAFWDKLNATPYLKTFLSLVRDEAIRQAGPVEEPPQEPPAATTHLPVENPITNLEEQVENLLEKHERELFSTSHGFSNCVQTDNPIIQLFSHQQARDQCLLWKTIEARLKISSPEKNLQEFIMKREIGDVLWLHYKKAMSLPEEPIAFEESLWNTCAEEVQCTYLKKPINMIKNGESRQSPDFNKHTIALFLKSQWVKKMEKLGADKIKPGQTIASFQQCAVMLYGTMARYMRRMRELFQPPHIFINCEQTPEGLSRWTKEQWTFKGLGYANDFTQFDQSQDGAMLQFEILKAKHHSIPEWVLEGYLDIKLNAHVFTGVLGIMRLTGEGPTFDANTECNIAYTHLRFDLPPNVAQAYSGDDSVIDTLPEERESFKHWRDKLALTAKPEIFGQICGDWPSFCGFLLTPLGALKEPHKLMAATALAEERKELRKCLDSYALDMAINYQHHDELYSVFDEFQMRSHQTTLRTLIKFGASNILQKF
nr:replication-associated protein [Plantago yellow mosaic virus]